MILLLRKLTVVLVLLSFSFLSEKVIANSREDAIKSGFIYNFARYSHGNWFNASQQKSYNICSFDFDFITTATNTLKSLSIDSRPVNLILLTIDNEQSTIINCHTLFISKEDELIWNTLLENDTLPQIMLVGEFDDFLASGGHINFFIISGKVRFEVAPTRLRESGIKMSSKVLRLGRIYKEADK